MYAVMGKEGYTFLYACLLSRWGESIRWGLRVMGWVSRPSMRERVSCRVRVS